MMMSRRHELRTVAALLVAAAALAAARPPGREVPRMELADAAERAVCPLKVVVDEDPLRLPRRIKFLTCDRAAARRPAACCRGRARHGLVTQCVEVFDNVVVQFLASADAEPAGAARHVLQVPVGCTCVLRAGTPALEDD